MSYDNDEYDVDVDVVFDEKAQKSFRNFFFPKKKEQ